MGEIKSDKRVIITTVSNWPEALVAQSALLRKFCKEPFEFVCVVDTKKWPSRDNDWQQGARERAIEIAIKYCDRVIVFPEELHHNRVKIFPNTTEKGKKQLIRNSPALRCADVTQYAWEIFRENYSSVMILDSDMFPIKDFSMANLLKGKSVAGVLQIRKTESKEVTYFWNGILASRFSKKPEFSDFSFDAGIHNGVRTDVGGGTWKWIQKNREDINIIEHLASLHWSVQDFPENISTELKHFIISDSRNRAGKHYSEIYDGRFLHLRGGSNWTREPLGQVHTRQSELLKCLNTLVPFQDFEGQISLYPKSYQRNFSTRFRTFLSRPR